MTTYKPEESAEGTSNPPLLQYLELVNVVDTVTSILQVYFDKDLVRRRADESAYSATRN
jgi:recyclin-1